MIAPPAPLLRSPPFPGVAADVAAVSLLASFPVAAETAEKIDAGRVRALVDAIVAARVGGTFWAARPTLPERLRILFSPADAADAARLADAALQDAAPDELLALLPAATWSAEARRALASRGIASVAGEIDPWPALEHARELRGSGDGELRLLARFAGLVTAEDGDDLLVQASAALLSQVRYRDCYSGEAVSAEEAVAQLAFWRAAIDRNRGIAVGAGIAIWKRREVAGMLWSGGPEPMRFFQRAAPAVAAAREACGAVAVWPSRAPEGLDAAAAATAVPLARVEDGFVRSIGLGAACHPPLSIVADRSGLHYDPSGPSDLETLLATADFPPELTARAERLAERLVAHGISKYAAGRGGFVPAGGEGRRRVLVPGQVEDDLSVRLGGAAVRGNLDLLARVRAAEPDAWILFKPHPDVDAGLRTGHVADDAALAHADEIVRDTGMAALLDAVDCVHVLTSLAGFEALLRGREVVTHGRPFYAGWGLTRDLAGPIPRRGRELTLPELVAAALILYPRYLDPVTGLPCPPEILVGRMAEQSAPKATWLTRIRDLQGRLRQPRRPARSAA